MKNFTIVLTAIIALSNFPAYAGQVSFGYANKGLSLKDVPKTFVTPSLNSLKLKGIEALGNLEFTKAADYFREAFVATNDLEQKAELKKYLLSALRVGGNSRVIPFPKEAIALLSEAITMQPNDFWLYARRGDAYCNSYMITQCIANHKVAIKLNPDKAEGVQRLAISLAYVDKPRSAKLFDLAASMYKERGNLKAAETTLYTKSSFGLSGY